MIFIDTNIAIDLRDGDKATESAVTLLDRRPVLSLVTRIELEGGAYRVPAMAGKHVVLLQRLLRTFQVIPLSEADVVAYGRIVVARGFDRRRILDRLIAAQAIVRGGQLITRNAADFREIEGLALIEW
ncbi:hypothetical protein IP88_16035 [alpha proteobacterium AAP81b]|nr:hypothetical protein IP88_16035 [alpha proteobacterium AAP81b]